MSKVKTHNKDPSNGKLVVPKVVIKLQKHSIKGSLHLHKCPKGHLTLIRK